MLRFAPEFEGGDSLVLACTFGETMLVVGMGIMGLVKAVLNVSIFGVWVFPCGKMRKR